MTLGDGFRGGVENVNMNPTKGQFASPECSRGALSDKISSRYDERES